MSEPYDATLTALLKETALESGIDVHEGVYASVAGPQLETRAEYRYLRAIGADAVGMSTVPEVIASVHMGMPCAAVSVLTDECNPDALKPFDLDEVVAMAQKAEPTLTKLFVQLIDKMQL